MTKKSFYVDFEFSAKGFVKVGANTPEEAQEIVSKILRNPSFDNISLNWNCNSKVSTGVRKAE